MLPSDLASLKSETEIPEFLKIYEKSTAPSDSDSTTMYTEMTLKNQRFSPQYPLRAPEPPPPVVKSILKYPPSKPIKPGKASKKDELQEEKRAQEVNIEFLLPRSVSVSRCADPPEAPLNSDLPPSNGSN